MNSLARLWRFSPALGTLLLTGCQPTPTPTPAPSGATEFCLEGAWDLGIRYQGLAPEPAETTPLRWCVTTEEQSKRVFFSSHGKANPDFDDSFSIAYLPPDKVRLVHRDAPPDVEFAGSDLLAQAQRVRRLDPRRLAEDLAAAGGALPGLEVMRANELPTAVRSRVSMPLRGASEVEWTWDWREPEQPRARLAVNGETLFRATGRWRSITAGEAAALWLPTPGEQPIQAPAGAWPTRTSLRRVDLGGGVSLVRGSRTGFQHLVVETSAGLVLADAPAGWVEFHHVPATDVVSSLGLDGSSGLALGLLDFLRAEYRFATLHTAVTHHHDDHAGGGASLASAGPLYAPAGTADFLQMAYRAARPRAGEIEVFPLERPLIIGKPPNRAQLLPMRGSPHVRDLLGVWAMDQGTFFVSDVHVPRNEEPQPTPEQAATECWFARWAIDNLPEGVQVVNAHSPVVTPIERLHSYVESEVCLAQAELR